MTVHLLRVSAVGACVLAALSGCGKGEKAKDKAKAAATAAQASAPAFARPGAPDAPPPLKLEPFWDDPSYVTVVDQAACPDGFWALFGADPPGETKEEKKANLLRKAELKKSLEGKTFLAHFQGPSEVSLGEYSNAQGEYAVEVKSTLLCKSPSLGNVTVAFGPVKPQLPAGRDFGQYYWLGDPVKVGVAVPFSQAGDFRAKHRLDLDARVVFRAGKPELHKKLVRSTETAEEAAERKKFNIPGHAGGMDDWGAGWVLHAEVVGERVAAERGRSQLAVIRK